MVVEAASRLSSVLLLLLHAAARALRGTVKGAHPAIQSVGCVKCVTEKCEGKIRDYQKNA